MSFVGDSHQTTYINEKSTFIYYIIEGIRVWVIEGIEYNVSAGDVVVVPPNKRFYYKGNLKQICLTTPAWKAEYEHHVRDVAN